MRGCHIRTRPQGIDVDLPPGRICGCAMAPTASAWLASRAIPAKVHGGFAFGIA
jgi:hypothetical protein